MRVSRTSVSQALFTLLQNAYAWSTADFRARVPDDLAVYAQPAMFLCKPAEDWFRETDDAPYQLTKYQLKYYCLVYVRAADTPESQAASAEALMDAILDAVDNALAPNPPAELQTLGGLVTSCYIKGRVEIDTPILFAQCAIWIPIVVDVGM